MGSVARRAFRSMARVPRCLHATRVAKLADGGCAMGRLDWACSRSRDIIRYEGWWVWLWRILRTGLAPLVRFGASRIYEKSLDCLSAPPVPLRGLTISPLRDSDFEAVVRLMAVRAGRGRLSREILARSRQTLLDRLDAGQECFVARIGGDVVHCGWVTFGWIEWPGEHWTEPPANPGRLVILGRDEAFHSDAYTHEAWRGRQLYAVALDHILRHLRERGIQRLYAEVGLDNSSSAKTYDRLRWRLLGTVLYLRPRGSSRAWRWVFAESDPFVTLPAGVLRFRSATKPGSCVEAGSGLHF
jgi:GNAT superfamily N-acetyltransferase